MAPKATKKKGGNKNYVPKYRYYAKDKLAAYPDEDGCPFYLGKGQDEHTFFTGKSIRASRSKDNEEMYHRPGMSLSLSCASFEKGIDQVLQFKEASLTEEQQKPLMKTGLIDILNFLATPEGKRFEKAVRKLNVGKHKRIKEEDAQTAIDDFVDVLREMPKKAKRGFSRWASYTANGYLFSMTLAKDAALLEDLPAMAENMVGNQSQSLKAWVKNSSNVKKFKKSLLAEFMDKVKKNSKEKKKRAADSSSEEEDDSDDDDAKARKPKGRKKGKKQTPGSEEDDSEDEDSDKKPRKKKAKKMSESDEEESEDEEDEEKKVKKADNEGDKAKDKKKRAKASGSNEDDNDNDAEKDKKKTQKKARKAKISESDEDDSEDKDIAAETEEETDGKNSSDSDGGDKKTKNNKKSKDKRVKKKDKMAKKVKKKDENDKKKDKSKKKHRKCKKESSDDESNKDSCKSVSDNDDKDDKDKKEQEKQRLEVELAKARQAAEQNEAELQAKVLEKVTAFSGWPQGNVQETAAKVHNLLQEVGDAAEGTFDRAEVQAILDCVPEDVKCLGTFVVLPEDEQIPNTSAKRALRAVLKLTTEAEEFWEEKGEGKGTGSTD